MKPLEVGDLMGGAGARGKRRREAVGTGGAPTPWSHLGGFRPGSSPAWQSCYPRQDAISPAARAGAIRALGRLLPAQRAAAAAAASTALRSAPASGQPAKPRRRPGGQARARGGARREARRVPRRPAAVPASSASSASSAPRSGRLLRALDRHASRLPRGRRQLRPSWVLS